MNNSMLVLLLLAPTMVILWRSIDLASTLSRKLWVGHPGRFAGFAVSIALTAGGAVGVTFGMLSASVLLLLGVSGWMFFDRRM
jgi:hypothetical protein